MKLRDRTERERERVAHGLEITELASTPEPRHGLFGIPHAVLKITGHIARVRLAEDLRAAFPFYTEIIENKSVGRLDICLDCPDHFLPARRGRYVWLSLMLKHAPPPSFCEVYRDGRHNWSNNHPPTVVMRLRVTGDSQPRLIFFALPARCWGGYEAGRITATHRPAWCCG